MKLLYEHLKECRAECGNENYLPRQRSSDGSYNTHFRSLRTLRERFQSGDIGAADLQLLALLPGDLQNICGQTNDGEKIGSQYFGAVEKCDEGWCWKFNTPEVVQCSKTFATAMEAEEELFWIHSSLYPIWLKPGERAAHLQYLMRRQEERRSLQALAHAPTLRFAQAHLAPASASSGPRLDLRPDQLVCGLPNLGNTCYLNAVTQCLFHCEPFRRDLESQSGGASFLGDNLRALLTAYIDAEATDASVRVRLASYVEQVLTGLLLKPG